MCAWVVCCWNFIYLFFIVWFTHSLISNRNVSTKTNPYIAFRWAIVFIIFIIIIEAFVDFHWWQSILLLQIGIDDDDTEKMWEGVRLDKTIIWNRRLVVIVIINRFVKWHKPNGRTLFFISHFDVSILCFQRSYKHIIRFWAMCDRHLNNSICVYFG